MKVNIRSEPGSWILPKCARAIRDAAPGEVRWDQEDKLWPDAQLEHGINWGYLKPVPGALLTAQFNHFNPAVAAELFIDRARTVDHAVVISEGARLDLDRLGIAKHKITLIELGIDACYQQPRLVLGVVGRCYEDATRGQDTRKGRHLLHQLLDHPWVQQNVCVRVMGDGWGAERFQRVPFAEFRPFELSLLPAFYATLDYLLCTSSLEGGPVPMLEALAMGIQTVIPRIGYAHTLPHVEYEAGSFPSLLACVQQLHAVKSRDTAAVRRSVGGWSWARWGERNVQLFRTLLTR